MNTYPICDSPPRRRAVQLCYVAEIAPKSSSLGANRSPGFVPFLEQKIQVLFKDFQGHISHFSRTPQYKREPWVCLFCFFHNMSNFILKVFLCLLPLDTCESGLDKVSAEVQGLSSTDCNFQGLSRPLIFILKLKDFQGACEHWKPYGYGFRAQKLFGSVNTALRGSISRSWHSYFHKEFRGHWTTI